MKIAVLHYVETHVKQDQYNKEAKIEECCSKERADQIRSMEGWNIIVVMRKTSNVTNGSGHGCC
jgi:hypothetical protein